MTFFMKQRLRAAIRPLLIAIVVSSAPSFALAQSVPSEMRQMLDRKYSILEQQAETERIRAETDRRRSEDQLQQQRPPSSGANHSGTIYAGVDALAGTAAPAYRLENGVVIRFSGVFWPSNHAQCIAFCPERP